MAKPDVRMNYESMDKMATEFDVAASQLDDTMDDMDKIVQMMEGGALLGQGGETFRDAITDQLMPNLNILRDKLAEESGDVMAAVRFTRDGVEDSRKKFT
ncbi:MAG: WXG100 family type VII secretion target [Anaerolineales bacterium]